MDHRDLTALFRQARHFCGRAWKWHDARLCRFEASWQRPWRQPGCHHGSLPVTWPVPSRGRPFYEGWGTRRAFLCPAQAARSSVVDARKRAEGSRQKVMRFEQPDKFGAGIFPASRKARAFARAWLSADRSAGDSFPDNAPRAARLADDMLRIAAGPKGPTRFQRAQKCRRSTHRSQCLSVRLARVAL